MMPNASLETIGTEQYARLVEQFSTPFQRKNSQNILWVVVLAVLAECRLDRVHERAFAAVRGFGRLAEILPQRHLDHLGRQIGLLLLLLL